MLSIPLLDTFIQQLLDISDKFSNDISAEYLFGTTGHGARFTLAMNTRTGKEIGHPTSHYIWDLVSVVEHCFPDAGIKAVAYLGPGYVTRARKTAAQTERQVPENVIILPDHYLDHHLSGHLLYPTANGVWNYATSTEEIDQDWKQYPFGPVVLDVLEMEPQTGLPEHTFRYLIDTIERGEEPMEIRGRNDYSAVSGWKAYARWMQSYSVPLPNVQHGHLDSFRDLLLERRTYFTRYLTGLAEQLPKHPASLISGLADRYQSVVEVLDRYKPPLTLDQVRAIYFAEQKTQTYYKKLDTYLIYGR